MADLRPMLLLTRPQAASVRFADQFRARFGAGWPVMIAPLMQTRFFAPEIDIAGVSHVIFTSETAVQALCRLTKARNLHAWCVGPRTGRAAQNAGFGTTEGPGNASGLVRMILAAKPAGRFLWPHGADIAQNIAAKLISVGTDTVSVALYSQDALPLAPDVQTRLSAAAPLLLPVFSPRSASLATQALSGHCAPLYIAAISAEAAVAATGLSPQRLAVASRPDSESLLDALGALISHLSKG